MDESIATIDAEVPTGRISSADPRTNTNEFRDPVGQLPPSQPRISWSKESERRRHNLSRSSAQGQNSKEAETSASERPNGLFRTLAGVVQSALRWGRLGSVTPGNSQASDSRFLNAEQTPSSNRESSFAMKTMEGKPNGLGTEHKTSRYINPAYVPRYSDSDEPDVEDVPEMPAGYRAYESGIYSVNAGGAPVPITIEESVEEEAFSSSDDEDAERSCSKSKLRPKAKTRQSKFHPMLLASAIWRKTYRTDSTFYYYWLMLVTLAVLYNLWIIPLRATFNTGKCFWFILFLLASSGLKYGFCVTRYTLSLRECQHIQDIQQHLSGLWLALDILCDVIYIVDIFIKFRTRFLQSGIYEKDRTELFQHHRREWTLALDIVSIFPTDIFFVLTINPYLRINRCIRIYRAYNLYRLIELRTNLPNIWRVINLMHFVALVVHYNACFYYTLSTVNGYGSTSTSWAYPDPNIFPDYSHLSRQYTYSFHWSLNSLFWNNRRATPENDWQFAYTIYVDVVGFAMTTFVIGYVIVLLMSDHSKKHEFERSMTSARRYMKDRHLPKELRHRVERFYQHVWLNCDFDGLDEANLLRHLPISVREEITLHGNYTALRQLPELAQCDSNLLEELVARMRRRFFLPGQTVYRSGDAGTEMYIVGEGVLQIIKESSGDITVAKDGDVFGEMNIFNAHGNRRRTCDVVSCGYSELFILTAEDVSDTLSKYPRVMNIVMQEARRNRAMLSSSYYDRKGHASTIGKKPYKDIMNGQTSSQSAMAGQSAADGSDSHDSGQGTSNASSSQWTNFNASNDSPDSAVPWTPSRKVTSDPGNRRCWHSNAIGMVARPDVVDKLNVAYEENLFALKRSLDGVWQQEVASLQKQLTDTEMERDNKAREVMQLRYRVVSANKSKATASGRAKAKTQADDNGSDANVRASKTSLKTNVKVMGSKKSVRKRTLLPSTAEGAQGADVAEDNSAWRPSAIQETPLDVYGSLTSLPSTT